MSLYVLISGFGEPHWEHKLQILRNNLEKIHSYPWEKIFVRVCAYMNPELYPFPIDLLEMYPHLEVVYEAGIVGQYIKKYANPIDLQEFTYVMILLDDIELLNIDFSKILQYQKDHQLDIISPCLSLDSKFQYGYLLHEPFIFDIKIATVCEYFCMFFKIEKFAIYYEHIHEENPWMWGLDLIIDRHLKLKVGLLNKMLMKHWYKSECYAIRPDIDPVKGYENCITRYGETSEQLSSQAPIKYYIVDHANVVAAMQEREKQ
jgi:hypothetical protein